MSDTHDDDGQCRVSVGTDVGGLIRAFRKQRGWSQATLAAKIGSMYNTTVSPYENGNRTYGINHLLKTLHALGYELEVVRMKADRTTNNNLNEGENERS